MNGKLDCASGVRQASPWSGRGASNNSGRRDRIEGGADDTRACADHVVQRGARRLPAFAERRRALLAVLGQFRGRGLSLLIAEQNVKFLKLADRVYALEVGRITFEGTVSEMHRDDALRRAYFGLR